VSACECTTCTALFCEICILEHYRKELQGANNGQSLCGNNCKERVIPFYTKELSDRNLKRFENILVACKNNEKGCIEALSPVGTLIKDHEARCLE
jgi:hypothetical protein